jgi:D-lyxose ketol-isomerase
MKRRAWIKGMAAGAAGSIASTVSIRSSRAAAKGGLKIRNEDFYTNGKFDEEKAKDGVLALCEHFGYPVFPQLRENLWVSDYGTGQFAKLGLAACMFQNHHDEAGGYMLMDLFLMPNQMLPEHWHLEGDHGITKDEGWLVRWGKSYIVGVGEDNLDAFPQIKIPEIHCGGTTSTKHVVEATPGTFVPLAGIETWHWQYGGPEGAIVTEVANFHTNSAVRHADKALNDYFLNG